MSMHLFYVSSWYPHHNKSQGTFIESQLRALREQGVQCAVLHTAEESIGNYLSGVLARRRFMPYRLHPEVHALRNLVVHPLPLRLYDQPDYTRYVNIVKQSSKAFEKYIKLHGKPDRLFHHGIFDYTYITESLSDMFEIPYWFMEHSSFIEPGKVRANNAFHTSDDLERFVQGAERRFAVSQAYAHTYEATFDVPFSVCPNVLTSDYFENIPDSRPVEPFRFVNVGIMEPHKNQELLLRAFAKNYRGNPHFQLSLAGDGSLLEHLRGLIAELDIEPQVDLQGFLHPSAIRNLLDRSNAFILTSLRETFGVVLIEAMARGIPVLAPKIPGADELINDVTGLCFNPDDIDDLCTKMNILYGSYTSIDQGHISAYARKRYGSAAFAKCLFDESRVE